MKLRTPFIAALVLVGLSALAFSFVQRQLSDATFAFGAHPEVIGLLEGSLADQKKLAKLDEGGQTTTEEGFEAVAQRFVQVLP